MRIRFYNGLVLTGWPAQPERAELWVKDDRIEYVGAPREDAGAFDREIDLAGDVVMPGFKNAHTHSAMTFLRSYADDLPLLDERQKEQARETGAVAFDACGTHYVIEGGAGEILRGYV